MGRHTTLYSESRIEEVDEDKEGDTGEGEEGTVRSADGPDTVHYHEQASSATEMLEDFIDGEEEGERLRGLGEGNGR